MGKEGKTKEFLSQGANWIDVRDVAEAHVKALETEDARDKRFLVAAGKSLISCMP